MQNMDYIKRILKVKVVFKEIFDFLTIRELAQIESLSRSFRNLIHATALDIYLNVKIIASDFSDFPSLINFIKWYSHRVTPAVRPHSFYLCINNYTLKDELTTWSI